MRIMHKGIVVLRVHERQERLIMKTSTRTKRRNPRKNAESLLDRFEGVGHGVAAGCNSFASRILRRGPMRRITKHHAANI